MCRALETSEEYMYQIYRDYSFSKFVVAVCLMICLEGGLGLAQTKPATLPDAQVEASVLKALAGAPELADQAITSTTVYGVVTLSGTVRDEPLRDLADHLVSNTTGVQKVVDQLVVGTVPAAANNDSSQQQDSSQGTNPNLQSDGSVAPAQTQAPPAPNGPNTSGAPQGSQQSGQYPPPYQGQQQQGQYPPPYQGQQSGQYPPYGAPQQGGQYPPQGQYPAYGQPYPSQYPPQRPYVAQKGGDAVVVPIGTNLRVRINQGLNSKTTTVGTTFDGVVLNDVVAGNAIAIPRGASIQGTVVAVHTAGELKGKGELKLQLNSVSLGGRVYPVATDFWWHQGADKTGNTVGNTVGLGAVGALIGGGVGAAVGAGVGGVAGLGVSAASGRGEAALPPEAILVFHLTQPADITTVSQAELNRLGAGVPVGADPQFRRRYPPPPPPGYYYGPGYYRPY